MHLWQVQDLLVASEKLREENQSLKLQNSDQSRQMTVSTEGRMEGHRPPGETKHRLVNISICPPPTFPNLGGAASICHAAKAGGLPSRGML